MVLDLWMRRMLAVFYFPHLVDALEFLQLLVLESEDGDYRSRREAELEFYQIYISSQLHQSRKLES